MQTQANIYLFEVIDIVLLFLMFEHIDPRHTKWLDNN